MSDYKYDPDLPYVVEYGARKRARFSERAAALRFSRDHTGYEEVIDTTPKPRVPEDAQIIMWGDPEWRYYAERSDVEGRWNDSDGCFGRLLENLTDVTPDTVFTVLDERKNR